MTDRTGSRRLGRLLVVVVAVMALVASACTGDDDDTTEAGAGTDTDSGEEAGDGEEFTGTVKIGFISDRTGAFSQFGVASYQGATLAVKQINDAGGVEIDGERYELELVDCETRSEEEGAQSCAVEVVEDEGAKYVFGGIARLSPIIMRVTEANDAIFFTSASAAAAHLDETELMVTTLGKARWRAQASVLAVTEFFPDAETIGMVAENDATLDQLGPAFEETAEDLDLELVTESVPVGTTDYTSALTNLKSSDPDNMIIIANSPEMHSAVIRANEEIDAAPTVFAYSASCQQAIDDGVDRPFVGHQFVGADLTNPRNERVAEFSETFQEWVADEDPPLLYSVLWNWDFYFMLVEAMERAGTVEDTQAVYDALFEIEYEGVVGDVEFGESKEAVYGFEMCYTEGETVDASDAKYIDPRDYDLPGLPGSEA